MRRTFAITAAATAIPTDGRGRGRLAVTVSNTRERPILARAKVVPGDGASGAWLSLSESDPFELQPLGTRQLELALVADADAVPGSYQCHIAVWDEDAPDEDYVDGPTILFAIAARSVRRRRFPWWWLLVAGVLIMAAGAPWAWATMATHNWQRRVSVPPLVGLPSTMAVEALSPDLRFGTVTSLHSSDSPLGSVVEQHPAPGTVLPAGGSVDVVVHGGLLVPDFSGTWIDKAKTVIAATGLVTGTVSESTEASDLPLGSVLRQQPKADQQVTAGTAVDLVVLAGVKLPDLRKSNLDFAQTALRTLGLAIVITPNGDHKDGIEKPQVVTQDPEAGTAMHLGGTVTVTVVYPIEQTP
jgi:eukaryotic-like serine/threonine-protein kinase